MSPTINREFGEHLLSTFDDPSAHPVHLLFNQFWQHAPQEVIDAYASMYRDDPVLAAWVAEGHYPEPLTLERLSQCGPGTLGEAMHTFIVDNNLEEKLATNYKLFHKALVDSSMLDRMPEEMMYAVLRGFQLHDFIHNVTGYGPSPRGEITVQALCLAQLPFPYFGMWVSVVTARMTFLDPTMIVPIMDAVSEGWQLGRSIRNIQHERWEERIDDQLVDVRAEYGIAPEGRAALSPASV
jgi:ubiquinone biosynthesis protein Coq4